MQTELFTEMELFDFLSGGDPKAGGAAAYEALKLVEQYGLTAKSLVQVCEDHRLAGPDGGKPTTVDLVATTGDVVFETHENEVEFWRAGKFLCTLYQHRGLIGRSVVPPTSIKECL